MENPMSLGRKIKKERKKIPHRQGLHNELMEMWEMLLSKIIAIGTNAITLLLRQVHIADMHRQ